ncbi:MAG: SHOCT domain-containing protein [Thermoanaerobaculia bacterium]
MHWGYGYGMGFGMIFWWVFLLILLGVIIWGMSRAMRGGASAPGAGSTASAEQILKERYARGEITREDYERMLSDVRR